MNFSSQTNKIPKGFGFLLKPSILSKALALAHLEINTSLIRQHRAKPFFDADFWPRNPNVPYERLYLVAGTAAAGDLMNLRKMVELEAVPRLVGWISDILDCDLNSPIRREKQCIRLI